MKETPQQYIDAHGHYIPQNQGVEVSVDTNGDGVIDSVVHSELGGRTVEVYDTDYDGKMELVLESGPELGSPVAAYLDSDGDGTLDVMVEDTDGDGVWDFSMIDSDGAGIFEPSAGDGTMEG